MSTSQLIFTHKNISKAIWENYMHTQQNGRKTLWNFFIFMILEPYIYYFMTTKTLNLSNVKYKRAHINSYLPIKYIKDSIRQWCPYSTKYFATKIVSFYSPKTLDTFYYFTNLLNFYLGPTPVKMYSATTLLNFYLET